MTYWFKPIGTKEVHLPEDNYKSYRYEVHFQKDQRPAGIHIGDVLILYAVGHKCLIGYCEVISRVFESSSTEQSKENWRVRFPFGVFAENKSVGFSENWKLASLSPQGLGKTYHELTSLPLTRPGREHLGAVEWGKSYFALADDFALHLITELNKSISSK